MIDSQSKLKLIYKNCIKFANLNPISLIATVNGDQPTARVLDMWYTNKSGYYFQMMQTLIHTNSLKNSKNF